MKTLLKAIDVFRTSEGRTLYSKCASIQLSCEEIVERINKKLETKQDGHLNDLKSYLEKITSLITYIAYFSPFVDSNVVAKTELEKTNTERLNGIITITDETDQELDSIIKNFDSDDLTERVKNFNDRQNKNIYLLTRFCFYFKDFELLHPYEKSQFQDLKEELGSKLTEIESTIEEMQGTKATLLKSIEDTAKEKIELIQSSARVLSIDKARGAFESSNSGFYEKARNWGIATCILFLVLGCFLWFLYTQKPEEINSLYSSTNPALLYHYLATKIAIIATLGTLITIVSKIFRTNLHLYEANKHRIRVVDSLPDLVNAAGKEDEGKVLMTLVNAIANPTDTGLTSTQESISPITNVIEAVKPKG